MLYKGDGMRAAFVAIGLALLACLLPFGMHSLAAGPGAE